MWGGKLLGGFHKGSQTRLRNDAKYSFVSSKISPFNKTSQKSISVFIKKSPQPIQTTPLIEPYFTKCTGDFLDQVLNFHYPQLKKERGNHLLYLKQMKARGQLTGIAKTKALAALTLQQFHSVENWTDVESQQLLVASRVGVEVRDILQPCFDAIPQDTTALLMRAIAGIYSSWYRGYHSAINDLELIEKTTHDHPLGGPNIPSVNFVWSQVYFAKKDFKKSLEYILKIQEKLPQDPYAQIWRSKLETIVK